MRLAVASLRSRASLRRLSTTALALLLATLHGASLGHLLFERHEVCPEHGELIHGDAARPHSVADNEPDANSARAVRAPHASEALAHADDHCTAVATRRDLAVLPASSDGLLLAPSAAPSAIPALAEARHEPRARYDVAPKQSPPA